MCAPQGRHALVCRLFLRVGFFAILASSDSGVKPDAAPAARYARMRFHTEGPCTHVMLISPLRGHRMDSFACFPVAFCSTGLVALAPEHGEIGHDGKQRIWSYVGSDGPAHWPELFNSKLGTGSCDGKRQSPIDIDPAVVGGSTTPSNMRRRLKVHYVSNGPECYPPSSENRTNFSGRTTPHVARRWPTASRL